MLRGVRAVDFSENSQSHVTFRDFNKQANGHNQLLDTPAIEKKKKKEKEDIPKSKFQS